MKNEKELRMLFQNEADNHATIGADGSPSNSMDGHQHKIVFKTMSEDKFMV